MLDKELIMKHFTLKNLVHQDITFELDKEFNFVGRVDENNVSIPLEGVSDRHALIFQKEGTYYLVDLASRLGTTVNDVRVDGAVKIKNGDKITFDKQVFALIDPEAKGTVVPDSHLNGPSQEALPSDADSDAGKTVIMDGPVTAGVYLTILLGTGQGKNIPLSKSNKMLIARKKIHENTIVIDHPSISRNGHCMIYAEGDEWRIVDSGSTNGVIVNGSPVTTAVLKDGNEIKLGDVVLEFKNIHSNSDSIKDADSSWDKKTVLDDGNTIS